MHLTDLISPARPLVLAGAGKMGGALLRGWLERGLPGGAVRVVDPSPPSDSAALLRDAGIESAASAEALAASGSAGGAGGKSGPETKAAVLVVAVKPQTMSAALPPLHALIDARTLVLSIAAGTTIATLAVGLGARRIVRAMPNTPAQIGKGISVAVATAAVDDEGRALATALLEAAGAVEWIADEALIDAVTAVSGSGPAYVFLLAEALAEAGVAAGLPPDLAHRLADATVTGAGALMAAAGEPPAALRKNVTSPGGTTEAALRVLMADDGLTPLLRRAVLAAQKRGKELAG